MNHRTRFINALQGKPVDRLPFVDPWGSPTAVNPEWIDQGHAPAGVDLRKTFGFDCADVPGAENGYEIPAINYSGYPPRQPPEGIPAMYPWKDLPDEGRVRLRYCSGSGRTAKYIIPDDPGEPVVRVFVDTAVHDRDEWLETKKYFQPSPQGRYPEDWEAWVEYSKKATHPVGLSALGLFNCLIDLTLGLEGETGLLASVYDRPGLVHEIIEHFTEFIVRVYDKALAEARIDFVTIGDQIGADSAPFISPEHFRQFFFDGYRRIVEFFRERVALVFYGGGNVKPYVPLLAEIGFNGLVALPREAEIEQIVARYGDRFSYWWCIDKWALMGSKQDIEREVDRKIALAGEAPFVPCLNELLAGVPFENYRHYAEYLRKRIFAA